MKQKFVIFLTFIVVIHIIVMILHTQYNKHAEFLFGREDFIHEVIAISNALVTAPEKERENLLKTVSDSDFVTALSDKPYWKIRVPYEQVNLLDRLISHSQSNLQVSIQLSQHQWANFDTKILTDNAFFQWVLIIFEFVVFCILLFALWSIDRFAKPLRAFKEAAEHLGVDLHHAPLKTRGPLLVQETAMAMNTMQQRIQELLDSRTTMLAAISHDLRTPLTRLRLRLQDVVSPDQFEKASNDIDEMNDMINQILLFAKEDSHKEASVKLDLASLISTLCNNFRDMGCDVEQQEVVEKLLLTGKPLALKRAFNNIIENAIKYGKKAIVTLKENEKEAIITITDEGEGIPPAFHERVFEPFFRVDETRSRKTGGTGLGLAVAKEIIKIHRGAIYLQNKQPHGLEVKIVLPKHC